MTSSESTVSLLISAVIDGAAATRCREATRDAPGARKAASAESTRTDANRSRDDIRSDSLCVWRSFDLIARSLRRRRGHLFNGTPAQRLVAAALDSALDSAICQTCATCRTARGETVCKRGGLRARRLRLRGRPYLRRKAEYSAMADLNRIKKVRAASSIFFSRSRASI